MSVDVADPEPEELFTLNEVQHLNIFRDLGFRKVLHRTKEPITMLKVAHRKLARNEWVSDHLTPV